MKNRTDSTYNSFQKHIQCQLIMSPYLFTLDTNKLSIALVVVSICQSILQWLEETMVHFNVILAITCNCIFLRYSHKSILQGSKHCCGDIYVICEDCLIIIQSLKYKGGDLHLAFYATKLLTKQNKHQQYMYRFKMIILTISCGPTTLLSTVIFKHHTIPFLKFVVSEPKPY